MATAQVTGRDIEAGTGPILIHVVLFHVGKTDKREDRQTSRTRLPVLVQ